MFTLIFLTIVTVVTGLLWQYVRPLGRIIPTFAILSAFLAICTAATGTAIWVILMYSFLPWLNLSWWQLAVFVFVLPPLYHFLTGRLISALRSSKFINLIGFVGFLFSCFFSGLLFYCCIYKG